MLDQHCYPWRESMNTLSNPWRRAGAAVLAIALATALAWAIWAYGAEFGLQEKQHKLFAFLLVIGVVVVGFFASRWLAHVERQSHRQQGQANKVYPQTDEPLVLSHRPAFQPSAVRDYLRPRFGLFWRRKVRLLLIVGEPEQIEAIAPGLAEYQWLEGQDTVLLWGGSVQSKLEVEQWRSLTRWRALDAVVWALDKDQSADSVHMGNGVRHLQALARELHWQVPLHLWQVCASPWPQTKRKAESVGCRLPARFTGAQLQTCLEGCYSPCVS